MVIAGEELVITDSILSSSITEVIMHGVLNPKKSITVPTGTIGIASWKDGQLV